MSLISNPSEPSLKPAGCRFRGRVHRQEKKYWRGTHRACPPEQTLAMIEPHYKQVGLTRLANITGLDCLGIPVVLAVRPNAAYLAVDAGKGVTLEDAMASAAMECIERYTAERADLSSFTCAYDELRGDYDAIPLENLALSRGSVFSPRRNEEWVLGWDIVNQREAAAPLIMVCLLGRHTRPPAELFSFQVGSNGLASGNHFLEALCAGLYELVERDAVTCHRMVRRATGREIPIVRQETIEYPLVRERLEQLAAADARALIYDCTVDTRVPAFMAYIYDRSRRKVGVYRGYGAHLDPAIAMIRALNEAAQARLVFISGARDDFFKHHFLRLKKNDTTRVLDHLDGLEAGVDVRRHPNRATGSFEGDIAILLERLGRVGLHQVIVHDLTLPGFDISVVRTLVPGLEGYLHGYYAPGPRALAMIRNAGRATQGGSDR